MQQNLPAARPALPFQSRGMTGADDYYKDKGIIMASFQSENCVFEQLENGTLSLSEYHGAGGTLFIPKLVERIPVSQVDADAFSQGGPVTDFAVPDDHPYFSAEDGVLFNREKNALVRYPFGRTEETFCVPSHIRDLRHSAFEGARQLRTVLLPGELQGMGSHAFSDCEKLEQLILPDSLERMGRSVFRGCVSLTRLDIMPDHPVFRRTDSLLLNIQDRSLILSLPALTGKAAEVPQDILQIGEFAFVHCNQLEKVTLHHGLRSVGRYAFYHCAHLRDISFPSSLRSIGSRAFSGCTSLRSLRIPDNVTNIEYKAFNNCDQLTLVVGRNSYAERYCRQFHFPCRHEFRWPWQK